MKVPNVKKDDMSVDLMLQLEQFLPKRAELPTWLLVDHDVYLTIRDLVGSSAIKNDHIEFRGWKVIGRGDVCEVG